MYNLIRLRQQEGGKSRGRLSETESRRKQLPEVVEGYPPPHLSCS